MTGRLLRGLVRFLADRTARCIERGSPAAAFTGCICGAIVGGIVGWLSHNRSAGTYLVVILAILGAIGGAMLGAVVSAHLRATLPVITPPRREDFVPLPRTDGPIRVSNLNRALVPAVISMLTFGLAAIGVYCWCTQPSPGTEEVWIIFRIASLPCPIICLATALAYRRQVLMVEIGATVVVRHPFRERSYELSQIRVWRVRTPSKGRSGEPSQFTIGFDDEFGVRTDVPAALGEQIAAELDKVAHAAGSRKFVSG